MLSVFSHPLQLDEPLSNFRVVGWYFSFLFKFLKKLLYKQTVDNSGFALFADVPQKGRYA